jgi:hypothetical protein
MMRLTINLDDDLYALGKGLAQAEDISISQAINRLLRQRTKPPQRASPPRRHRVSALPVSQGRRLITAADVRKAEQEDDLP